MPLQVRQRNLVPFVKFIVLSFATLAEKRKVALKFRADTKELPLYFDSDKVEHVISNLLSNAFKFTSEHGKILVSVAEVTEDGTPYAEITVKDTGTGIPAEEIPFIFDRFHQADVSRAPSRDGTGIRSPNSAITPSRISTVDSTAPDTGLNNAPVGSPSPSRSTSNPSGFGCPW